MFTGLFNALICGALNSINAAAATVRRGPSFPHLPESLVSRWRLRSSSISSLTRGKIAYANNLSLQELSEFISKGQHTSISGLDIQLICQLIESELAPEVLANISAINVSGSDDVQLIGKVSNKLRHVRIMSSYGATEAFGTISSTTWRNNNHPGYVGKVAPDI